MKMIQVAFVYLVIAILFCRHFLLYDNLPGLSKSDLWNSLWTIEQIHLAILEFRNPFVNHSLNFPDGGSFWPIDPLGALLCLPLRIMANLETAYQVHACLLLAFLGMMTHAFSWTLWKGKVHRFAPFVAGIGVMGSSFVLSLYGVGASEMLLGGFWVWALVRIHLCIEGKAKWLGTFLIAAIAMLANWYFAVMLLIFLMSAAACNASGKRTSIVVFTAALVLLFLPIAYFAQSMTIEDGSIVGAKSVDILSQVRRTIGPANPLSFVVPYAYDADFKQISRFGEAYRHDVYIGVALLGAGLWNMPKLPKWFWLGGLSCFVLSLGPVLVKSGQPVLFADDLAIPLPYFLLEEWPGFSSLSLLYRFGFGLLVVVAISAIGVCTTGKRTFALIAMISLDLFFLAPSRARIPGVTPPSFPTMAVDSRHKGGAINWPLEGGRPFLFEQIKHQMPITSGINFPINSTAKIYWDKLGLFLGDDQEFCTYANRVARTLNIRYVFIHDDALGRPDSSHKSAQRLKAHCSQPVHHEHITIVEHL